MSVSVPLEVVPVPLVVESIHSTMAVQTLRRDEVDEVKQIDGIKSG